MTRATARPPAPNSTQTGESISQRTNAAESSRSATMTRIFYLEGSTRRDCKSYDPLRWREPSTPSSVSATRIFLAQRSI